MDYGKDSYTTVAQVQTYLDRTLDSNETNALGFIIPAVSRWIDRALGTCFDKLDETNGKTARHFRGGFRNINIDACQQISLVQAINPYDNSVWYTYSTPLEYIAEPYDLPVKRYLTIRKNEFTGNTLKWPGDDIGILVTALFTEYDYVGNKYPDDIVQLANHICAVWLQNNQNTDIIQREQIEGHLIQKRTDDLLATDPMVTRVLDSRQEIWLED